MIEIIHLSFDEAIAVYEEIMALTDSIAVMREPATLEFILLDCAKLFNEEKDLLLFKAAYLLKEIISKHPFMDGNKRGALAISSGFLKLNGYSLRLNLPDVAFLEEIDSKKYRVSTVKKFLEKKVHPNV